MAKKIPLSLLVILLCSLVLVGPAAAQGLNQKPIDFKDYEPKLVDYTLANGLRVILAEDHSAPVVAVDTWYRVGGANDPEHRAGFAHLFEHMMFEGSAHVPNGYTSYCTSFVPSGINLVSGNRRRSVSFRPWRLVGASDPGGSNRQLPLAL
jgi:hypothetical protein